MVVYFYRVPVRYGGIMMNRKKKPIRQVTAIYCRLTLEDGRDNESMSISNQELICEGWFLPPNTYDCGSFVVNSVAVVGKERKTGADL